MNHFDHPFNTTLKIMSETKPPAIPSTYEMLERTKRPKIVNSSDWVENYSLIGLVALGISTFAIWGLNSYGWISRGTAKLFLTSIIIGMILIMIVWGITQIITVYQALKAGYRPMAERIDAAVEEEQKILDNLMQYDSQQLQERSKHLELEIKVLGRRAGLATIATAIALALINLLDAAVKVSIWPDLPQARFFVYAGSLGISIGSVLLIVFVGKLERIAGLFALAAERATKLEAKQDSPCVRR